MTAAEVSATVSVAGALAACALWLLSGCTTLSDCKATLTAPRAASVRRAAEAERQFSTALKSLCTAPAFQPMFAGSPCLARRADPAQLNDATAVAQALPAVQAHSVQMSAAVRQFADRLDAINERMAKDAGEAYRSWDIRRAAETAKLLNENPSWGALNQLRVRQMNELEKLIERPG